MVPAHQGVSTTGTFHERHPAVPTRVAEHPGPAVSIANREQRYAEGDPVGVIAGTAYAEGFITYEPEIAEGFPLSERRLRLARQSEADWHASADRIIATRVEPPD